MTCPVCDKPSKPDHHPFCSQGCRDRDLLQWLDEGYKMPVSPHEDDPE